MKKIIAATVLLAMVFLSGCSTGNKASKATSVYKGVYSGELTTLNYLVTASTSEAGAAANLVDGLVESDSFGIIRPALATSWEPSPDGLTWTFHIRQGVKWLTWDGKEYAEVTAQDWVDALKYEFDPQNASKVANTAFLAIKNGQEYFNGTVKDFSEVGVKALDKYTLQYTLKNPLPYFLSMLTWVSFYPANGQFLAEKGKQFGTDNKSILYNGAYIMTAFEPQTRRVFEKNQKYWDAGKVYIERIELKYNKEASTLAPALFTQGDVTEAFISSAQVDSWMNDPAKKDQVRPASTSFYTYFYAFNFDPKFPKEYEPDNWKVAVNNVNFRKALFYALDRKAAMLTSEPYDPDRRLSNTLTPRNFCAAAGKDYTEFGPLAEIVKRNNFNVDEAKKYKDLAVQELKGKATFPVKIMMPYNAGSPDWVNRAQVVEQQLEGALGKDFIDVIPVGFPATGFLNATRRAGNYAMQECNGGPGFADPDTYTGMFLPNDTYSHFSMAQGYTDSNGKNHYENMINAARAEVKDVGKRYQLFAEAEAFLINEAVLIPYAIGGGGYVASKVDPFTAPFTFALNGELFKGLKLLDKPMNSQEYKAAYEKWQADRAAALKEQATK